MKLKKYIMMVLFLSLFLTACGQGKIEPTMSSQVEDFEFTTQDGDTLSLNDLKGQWWIADFIFTNCTTVCLPMTSNMVQLQAKLKEANLDEVQLISFTVDPERDSPEVLKEYAESYGADLSNWTFLTGYDFERIQEFSYNSFMSMVQKDPNSDQVGHTVRFFLINPEGEIIKSSRGDQYDQMDVIVEDLKKVF